MLNPIPIPSHPIPEIPEFFASHPGIFKNSIPSRKINPIPKYSIPSRKMGFFKVRFSLKNGLNFRSKSKISFKIIFKKRSKFPFFLQKFLYDYLYIEKIVKINLFFFKKCQIFYLLNFFWKNKPIFRLFWNPENPIPSRIFFLNPIPSQKIGSHPENKIPSQKKQIPSRGI